MYLSSSAIRANRRTDEIAVPRPRVGARNDVKIKNPYMAYIFLDESGDLGFDFQKKIIEENPLFP